MPIAEDDRPRPPRAPRPRVTCSDVCVVAVAPRSPSRRTTFSTMTTAPSTMRPKSIAPRLIRLPEIPAGTMPMNAKSIDERDRRGRRRGRRAGCRAGAKQHARRRATPPSTRFVAHGADRRARRARCGRRTASIVDARRAASAGSRRSCAFTRSDDRRASSRPSASCTMPTTTSPCPSSVAAPLPEQRRRTRTVADVARRVTGVAVLARRERRPFAMSSTTCDQRRRRG